MKLIGKIGVWIFGRIAKALGREIKKDLGTIKVTSVKVIR
jgi:hypothetical protein